MPSGSATNAPVNASYVHPWFVRFCHWANTVTLTVMAMSGLQIFVAFPSFGPKIPQENFVNSIPNVYRLGGWLGGGLQWHFTFMWLFAGAGLIYLVAQIASGHFRTLLFRPRDVRGVWPMVRHYVLSGPEPPAREQYNALQKLAYTLVLALGLLSVVTGVVLFKAVQFAGVERSLGGYATVRLVHFLSMCGLVAFIPAHLIMVALHGWNNFMSMVTGWRQRV